MQAQERPHRHRRHLKGGAWSKGFAASRSNSSQPITTAIHHIAQRTQTNPRNEKSGSERYDRFPRHVCASRSHIACQQHCCGILRRAFVVPAPMRARRPLHASLLRSRPCRFASIILRDPGSFRCPHPVLPLSWQRSLFPPLRRSGFLIGLLVGHQSTEQYSGKGSALFHPGERRLLSSKGGYQVSVHDSVHRNEKTGITRGRCFKCLSF